MPRFITRDGLSIHYRRSGDGPPLIFLHGLGAHLSCWRHQEAFFSAQYTVLLLDLRGFGESDKPRDSRAYGVKSFAEDVHQLLVHLKVPGAHLVGTSMGGYVAEQFALQYPEKVKSLVLCNTACRRQVPPELMRARSEALERSDMSRYARLVASQALAPGASDALIAEVTEMIASNDRAAYETVIRSLTFDVCEQLASVRVPVLLIGCDEDIVMPLDRLREIRRWLPQARLEIIERCGHLPYMERPDVFNQILASFLAEISHGGGRDKSG